MNFSLIKTKLLIYTQNKKQRNITRSSNKISTHQNKLFFTKKLFYKKNLYLLAVLVNAWLVTFELTKFVEVLLLELDWF